MGERRLKAAKSHLCDACGKEIKKDEVYIRQELRAPAFNDPDDPDLQTGIDYLRWKICLPCNDEANESLISFTIKKD